MRFYITFILFFDQTIFNSYLHRLSKEHPTTATRLAEIAVLGRDVQDLSRLFSCKEEVDIGPHFYFFLDPTAPTKMEQYRHPNDRFADFGKTELDSIRNLLHSSMLQNAETRKSRKKDTNT